jgi:hypothetical protein
MGVFNNISDDCLWGDIMYVSHNRVLDYKGALWLVNAKPSGIFPSMAKNFIDQFFNMLSHYKRVHVIRFDLHQRDYNPDNSRMTKFIRRLKKRLIAKYKLIRIGYCWVREQDTAAAQHYHYVLFLDQRVVNYPHKVLSIIAEVWQQMAGFSYTPKHCYYNVTRDDYLTMLKVVYRISYFAKVKGKGIRPPQTKDYSTSRIRYKS